LPAFLNALPGEVHGDDRLKKRENDQCFLDPAIHTITPQPMSAESVSYPGDLAVAAADTGVILAFSLSSQACSEESAVVFAVIS
jgi:hypothetical protein